MGRCTVVAIGAVAAVAALPLGGGDPAECGHFHHTMTTIPKTTSMATTLRTAHTYPI